MKEFFTVLAAVIAGMLFIGALAFLIVMLPYLAFSGSP